MFYEEYKEQVRCRLRYSPKFGGSVIERNCREGFLKNTSPDDVADFIDTVFEQNEE